MKIIVVCSRRDYAEDTNFVAPFVHEQVKELQQLGCEINYVLVKGGGWKSYLKTFFVLRKKIKEWNPDVIHAHGGHCGLIANIQRRTPVITTYHGSDINNKATRYLSFLSIKLSIFNIFVSQKLADIASVKKQFAIIPCGVDSSVFFPMDKNECRLKLSWDKDKIYILFSKAFFLHVKNYPLAKSAVDKIENAILVELDGFTREEVNLLFNACDLALMTSFSEGSPQFVKEAMACNKSVISTDVGDVKDLLSHTDNSYLCSFEVEDVFNKINLVLNSNKNNNSRDYVLNCLDNKLIAKQILIAYNNAIKK